MRRRGVASLETLDQAIELLRTDSLKRLVLCAAPGLFLTWLGLLAHYLEYVEGVRSLRALFALGLAAGWCVRCAVLARFAGRCVDRQLARFAAAPRHGASSTVLRVASVVGVELWFWLWLLVGAVRIDPWLALGALPLFALRGALAPGWLAAAEAATGHRTFEASLQVLAAAEGKRLAGVGIELFILLGAAALFLNLGALLVAAISLSQDLLGLKLAFVRAFISPRNHFALLALAGFSLSAFEPLRAAVSGVLYAETRAAHEAVEVRALVRGAIAKYAVRLLPWMLAGALAQPHGFAQDAARPGAHGGAQDAAQPRAYGGTQDPARPDALSDSQVPSDEECDQTCNEARARDDAVLVTLVGILDAPDFRDFPSETWALEGSETSFRAWLERFFHWLAGGDEAAPQARDLSKAPAVHLPLPWLLMSALALALAFGVALLWRTLATRTRRAESIAPAQGSAPQTLPPSASAHDDEPRAALRALYLAALAGLSHRGLLTLSSASTNGDYLRALRAPERALLTQLTQLFELVRYGQHVPSPSELAQSQRLVAQLVDHQALAA